MNAHRIETRLTEDQILTLKDLPFRAGDNVEVIVLEKQVNSEIDSEDALAADWKPASNQVLQEVWDNDEDAAYDNL